MDDSNAISYGGLTFEVEHIRPMLSPWDLIIRCVGSLPDTFEMQTGELPANYDDCVLVNEQIMSKVQSCRSLGISARDRLGKPRVDMVGISLFNADDADAFVVGTQVTMLKHSIEQPPTGL